MTVALIYLALILIGLCLGSFAGAMVWRLRARQLVVDRSNHESYDKHEYEQLKKLTTKKVTQDHSQCLHCSYRLRWYDLIPLVSWISLRGRCRQCRKPIGYFEPLIEISVALLFVASYALWPYPLVSGFEIAQLVIWLIAGVGLAILFAYDAKWLLLPDRVNITVIGLGLISAVCVVLRSSDVVGAIISVGAAVGILSGLYFILYVISRGKWIGFGDIKLGLGLALLLADWRLAFIALFTANLIGCLVVLPQMVRGTLKRTAHVPFGPLLIAGTVIAQLVGFYLVDIYLYDLM